MVPILVSLLVQGVGGLFLVLVCFTLYASRGRLYFLYWTLAWFCLSLGHLLHGWQLEWEHLTPDGLATRPWVRDMGALCLAWHAALWLLGVRAFHQNTRGESEPETTATYTVAGRITLRTTDLVLVGASVGAVLVSRLLPAHAVHAVLAAVLMAAYAWSLTIFANWKGGGRGPGLLMLTCFLALHTLEQLHHFTLHSWLLFAGPQVGYPDYFRYVNFADFLLRTLTGVGMIVFLLDQDHQTLHTALARLGESENRFRLMFENGGVGMALLSPDGHCLEVNPALEGMLGYDSAELRGKRLSDFGAPEEASMRLAIHRQSSSGLLALEEKERRYRHKDGSSIWVHVFRVPVRNAAGKIAHVVCVLVDITARRQAEQTLREERDFSDRVLQTADALIVVVDPAGRIVRFNGKCAAVSGYSEDEARGRVLWDFLLHPDCVEPLQETFERLRTTWAPCVLESTWRTRAGQERLIAWRYSAVRDEERDVRYVIGAGLDHTDQRRLEEQLRHAQKMETLGTLVGGIAHDFNNQLTAIVGNLGLALMEVRDAALVRQTSGDTEPGGWPQASGFDHLLVPLQDAENAAVRCADMTKRLLAFSRSRIGQRQPLNLNELLAEATRLIRRVIPSSITIEVEAEEDLWLVNADVTQLHQAVMNLAVNARDAMPEGGKLLLRTQNRLLTTADCARNVAARPGKFVVLTVADTGVGLTPEVLGRIFEPFFTTKEAGKGTGLGLMMVSGTVKAHRGWIAVDSQPGRGSSFQLFLPAGSSEVRLTPSPNLQQFPPVEQTLCSGRVLLVDDDELVRSCTSSVLQRLGFRVVPAANGAEALELYHAQRDELDVVLLDLTMPGMGGVEVFTRLRKLNPEVRVVFSSGVAASHERIPALEEPTVGFVPKPYQPQDLRAALRRVLDYQPSEVVSG